MDKGGGSRLLQMQARFQQKQMQEREMKIASLYEAQQTRALDKVRHSPNGTSHVGNAHVGNGHVSNGQVGNGHVGNGHVINSPPQQPAATHQPGKVRQMFEERRTKAGIDKSYPLQPIQNTERARKPLPNGYSKVTTSRVTVDKRQTKTQSTTNTSHSIKKVHQKAENIVNGSGDLNHNHEPDLNTIKNALPQSQGEIISNEDKDEVDNNLLENETFPDALAPAPTPRSPEPLAHRTEVKPPPRRSPAASSTKPTPTKPRSQPPPASPRRVVSDNTVSDSKTRGAMQKEAIPKRQPAVQSPRASKPRSVPSPSSTSRLTSSAAGDACTVCGRRFASDRIAKHQEICKKSHSKKRKPYDVLKHRLAGTEAEPFIGKIRRSTNAPPTKAAANKSVNSNWRQKHEEFINAIRAAKQVQAHLNAGGKLSDLPPPPPSENPDYVQCPSCGRRFNQGAAERHIPKCKDYQFNKPKPAAKRR